MRIASPTIGCLQVSEREFSPQTLHPEASRDTYRLLRTQPTFDDMAFAAALPTAVTAKAAAKAPNTAGIK